MATHYNKAPPLLTASKNYEDWKKKVNIWNRTSTLDASSKASQVFLSLTGDAEDAVLELEEAEIYHEDGLTKILERLDCLYKKDETLQKVQHLETFESYERTNEMTILQHIVKFDQLYNKIKKYGSSLSDDILAFKLMKSAKLSSADEKLAKASSQMTYEAMKTQLKKIFTENSGGAAQPTTSSDSSSQVKFEDVHFNTGDTEDTFYMKQRNYNGTYRKNTNTNQQNRQRFNNLPPTKRGRNPLDHQGRVMRCHHCESINHLNNACPDKLHGQQQQQYTNRTFFEECCDEMADDFEQSVVLFQADFDKNRLKRLLSESWDSAVLDCGASKTVCGRRWFTEYKGNLPQLQQDISVTKSKSLYRFGDGKKVPSIGCVKLPAILGEQKVTIDCDVVEEDIPLLFSRSSMKKAGMLLNFQDNTVEVFNKTLPMNITSTGHCTIPISPGTQLLQHFR